MDIRPATAADHDALWRILEPAIREGETYALPRDMTREAALAYWCGPGHEVTVAEENGEITATYFLRTNHPGGGSHVANCGYMVGPWAAGRGLARRLCAHSIERARARGYRAIQFNYVVSTNERAVAAWRSCGFEIVGRLPGAFHHPRLGDVDVFVMFCRLSG